MSRMPRLALIALCLAGLVSSACTRMTRMPTMASKDSQSSGTDSGSTAGSGDSSDDSSADSSGSSFDGSTETVQDSSGGNREAAAITATTVVLSVGALAIGALFWLVHDAGSSAGPPSAPAGIDSAQRRKAVEDARRWLAAHRRQVRTDIARGAGPFVDELALMHRIAPELRPLLGAALQEARGALDAPLAGGPPSADQTLRFVEALVAAVQAQPMLAAHVVAHRPPSP